MFFIAIMKSLGISAYYHDSAAALICDGRILGAVQEERFSRKKNDNRFPKKSVEYLLQNADITINDIDYVVYYEKPSIKFFRVVLSHIRYAPLSVGSLVTVLRSQLNLKLWVKSSIRRELGYKGQIIFIKHHESHAASAFFASPFDRAAFLTLDGVGEWDTATFGVGEGNHIAIQRRLSFPHSLGLLYAAFTYFIGFKINSGEYKVMGLAPYGTPKYTEKILSEIVQLKEDGFFTLNMDYFDFVTGGRIISDKFEKCFGRAARKPEALLTQDDMDMARSIQDVTELILLKLARHIRKETGMKYLCLAGGVALNCVANAKILKEKIFDDIWIQPASGDAGGALGAALYVWYQHLNNVRDTSSDETVMQHSFLGPEFSNEEIKEFLSDRKIPYQLSSNIEENTAHLIAQGNIVGWFNGRMEFGPRALGSRSILGDARQPEMQKVMNLKIKFRESFRPFAPAILEEKVSDWFMLDRASPFMLLVADVKEDKRLKTIGDPKISFGLEKLNMVRSLIPAVTHVDYSARIQTVSKKTNIKFHTLISYFYDETRCPVIVNTSFNVRGEPIVCTPEDAYNCFMRTEIDYLVLGDFLIDKREQPKFIENDDWRTNFVLD